MERKVKPAISPTRNENYPEWYQEVIKAADLAETSPVKGCMVIKPWGYAIWENIQSELDKEFKSTGHKNAYFPLFIPLRYLQKEADHVEGFAKECAVVTHSKLELDKDGNLKPASELQEPLVVRPTSETIIGELFSKWVNSYRDLPLLINQWANVVRWEMRTRLFLRTTEFLWQEGHTVHSSKEEAIDETLKMLEIYAKFCENYLAMPVIKGEKTAAERFPGAVSTYSIEVMMQDKKALQAGTSHFLGQNFSKSSSIKFLSKESKEEFAWTTSWGVSTRLIGGLIMTHSDDDGLVLPPAIAPSHVVIMPITPKDDTRKKVLDYCLSLKEEIIKKDYLGSPIKVELDDRDIGIGEKKWSWVKKGIPIRLEIGPRDIENESICFSRRDKKPLDKEVLGKSKLIEEISKILESIQNNLLNKAKDFQKSNIKEINNKNDFIKFFKSKDSGFALVGFCLDPLLEDELAKELKISIRCIPDDTIAEKTKCIFSGKEGTKVIFARSY